MSLRISKWVRVRYGIKRLVQPSTWRLIALVVSDPRWDPLFVSLKSNPGERFRNPVPWYAWNAIPVVEAEVSRLSGEKVLEWGTGSSTLWYARRGMRVTGIEHDPQWFDVCARHVAEADLRLIPLGEQYASPTVDLSEFRLIVIDGRLRSRCAKFVSDGIESGAVKPGTVIIFDDSNRSDYAEALENLARLCSSHRAFSGPTSVEIDKLTTVFWV